MKCECFPYLLMRTRKVHHSSALATPVRSRREHGTFSGTPMKMNLWLPPLMHGPGAATITSEEE
jgi:hypothetical protein